MIMKKWIALLLAGVMAVAVTGCKTRETTPRNSAASQESSIEEIETPIEDAEGMPLEEEPEPEVSQDTEGPQKAARALLNAMQSGDKTKIQSLIDYSAVFPLAEGQSDEDILTILQRMQYSVLDTAADGGYASVEVQLTNVDMNIVHPAFVTAAMELEYNNAISESPKSPEEMAPLYSKKFLEVLDANKNKTVARTVKIAFIQENGEWHAQAGQGLGDALLGDYFKALENGQNMG